MKKLFLLLTCFMLLAACSSDDDSKDDDLNDQNCNFCLSNYSGTFDVTIDGESASNRPMMVQFELTNNLYSSFYTLDFDSFNNWGGQQFPISGILQNGNTLFYENRIWNLQGMAVVINGTVTFNSDFTMLTGEFALTGGHTGTISFIATL